MPKKGNIPWNKGKSSWSKGKKFSDEHKRKISEAKIGHIVSKETKKKLRDANKINNLKPFLGKVHTEETKKRISEGRKGQVAWNKGIRVKSSLQDIIRNSEKYKKWRSSIFLRDNWTCQTCRERGYVEAHHVVRLSEILYNYNIKEFEEAEKCNEIWSLDNGVTLCLNCHKEIHLSYNPIK